MRHRKSGRKLKRTASHRKALLASLSTALLRHKKIRTTVAKAKEARMFVEKLITRAKNAAAMNDKAKDVHARRMVARYIKDKDVVRELFGEIAQKVANRAGGYTRIVKLGRRLGDGAEVALLELVDYQGVQKPEKSPKAEKEVKADKSEKSAKKEKSPKTGKTGKAGTSAKKSATAKTTGKKEVAGEK